jgi:DNA-binding transcriptional ArsR family regulator
MSAFAVVAEPTRRRILDELLDGEQPVNALVERLGVSQPSVSKHLKVLRDAGLVAVRVDRQSRQYRLQADSLAEIEQWLAPFRKFWTGRLDALERHLDEEASDD